MENKYPNSDQPDQDRQCHVPQPPSMGAINDPVMMENILGSGKADVIYITGAICEGYHAALDI